MRPAVSGDHYMLGLPTLKPEAAAKLDKLSIRREELKALVR